MQTVYLLKYNNYYDRIVKKEEKLSNYLLADPAFIEISNYDFVPGDGVSKKDIFDYDPTSGKNYVLVCNTDGDIESRWFITETVRTRDGRYLVSLNRDAIVDEYENLIHSPMFIEKATISENDPFIYNKEDVQTNQIKTGEFLIRDETRVPWLIAYISRKTAVTETYKETIYDGPSSVESEKTHTIFHGADPISVNIPLQRVVNFDFTSNDIPMLPLYDPTVPEQKRYTSFSNYTACQYTDNPTYVIKTYYNARWHYYIIGLVGDYFRIYKYWELNSVGDYGQKAYYYGKPVFANETQKNNYIRAFRSNKFNGAPIAFVDIGTENKLGALSKLDKELPVDDSMTGKVCHDIISNENYRITKKTISKTGSIIKDSNVEYGAITNAGDAAAFYSNNLEFIFQQIAPNETDFGSSLEIRIYPSSLISAEENDIKITEHLSYCEFDRIDDGIGAILYIDPNTLGTQLDHKRCEDACYDIVYMPYFDGFIDCVYNSHSYRFKVTKESAIMTMQRIKTCCGENCTDVQIVPFCPDKPITKWEVRAEQEGNILTCYIDSMTDVAPMYEDVEVPDFESYVNCVSEGLTNAKNLVFWSSSCSNSRTITNIYNDISSSYPYDVTVEEALGQTESIKVANQCNIARLVSPNYNGQFEFSPCKMVVVDRFNIDFMYMPYTPYIHVSPNFGGLYGEHSLNGKADATGLICNGSFSIPQYDDKWADYCIQNKNYQNMFDREIKNMEVNNRLTNTNNIVNAITGIAAGGIGGAIAGKNPASIATGAISGAVRGITKISTDLIGQRETLDYKSDMYTMNLQNIQALPYSLSNVGVFNNNNKIFPFVEIYTCTQEEKIAFENKLKYNGMTVGKIGFISEYVDIVPNYSYIPYDEFNYIKGKLIRLNGTNEDNHFINYLASEMDKGAFFRRNQ